ncbi:class I SAM-dependent methyltransferase [Candidatus Woesearchaeota archaeon]|nr:class I SAM-dependent methyltransferase [Candidatus Woesearchaeota archaeon]
MLVRIFDVISRSPNLKQLSMKIWYQYLSRLDKDSQIIFMNYGYDFLNPNHKKIKLKDADEKDRYCIQLYSHVAGAVDLRNLNVLEVGCGRGGGSSYLMRYLSPKSVTGIDFSRKAMEFCKRYYHAAGLSFCYGNAESLPFEDRKFDAIVNIESSHCYSSMDNFLGEVARVLRTNGYFLFADFRSREKIDHLRNQLRNSGLKLLKERRITGNVLKSLDSDNKRRSAMIKEKVPKVLRNTFLHFAGAKGTDLYKSFKTGEREYYSFVLQK